MQDFYVQLFSIRVAIFVISYCFLMGVFYFLIYNRVQQIYQGLSLGKVAFELVSLMQFIFWLPLGFGFLGLNAVYLFLLPMVREIFDFILIFIVDKKSFSPKYRRFIFSHHLNSTIARVALLIVSIFAFKTGAVPFLRVCLLYYCCSFFLVAPGAMEKLIFRNPKAIGLSYFKILNFLMARVSHFAIWMLGIFTIWNSLLSFHAVLFSILMTALAVINEYLSISSGLPTVRDSWLTIQTDISQ